MALVDARGFQLTPDLTRQLLGGLRVGQSAQQYGIRATAIQQAEEEAERKRQIQELLGGIGIKKPLTQQEQMLAQQTAELAGISPQAEAEQPQATMSFEERRAQARRIDPVLAEQQFQAMGMDDASKRAEASRFAARMATLPEDVQNQEIMQRAQMLRDEGRDPSDTLELLDMSMVDRMSAYQGIQMMDLATKDRLKMQQDIERATGIPADQQAFENLIKDFTPEEKAAAYRIKAGLMPRAVGSADQTITNLGTAELVGDTQAVMEQRRKFGELTGASRAKAIDKGIERIQKIDQGLRNIDRAIAALDEGASTGALQQFAPTIRASTVELENVRNMLALDVLNAATFGALSENELRIVQETALPTKLPPDELRQWLETRRRGEQKLRAYFMEQIDHLDQGGTVASFLRMKTRESQQGAAQQPGAEFEQGAQVGAEAGVEAGVKAGVDVGTVAGAEVAQPAPLSQPQNIGRFQVTVE